MCGRGPSCQPLHIESSSDGCPSLTMLTRSRREHLGSGQRRGLGRDDAEPGKTQQWMPTRSGVRGFTGSLWCEAVIAAE